MSSPAQLIPFFLPSPPRSLNSPIFVPARTPDTVPPLPDVEDLLKGLSSQSRPPRVVLRKFLILFSFLSRTYIDIDVSPPLVEAVTPPPLIIQREVCRGGRQDAPSEPRRSTRRKRRSPSVSSDAEDEYVPPPLKKPKLAPQTRSKGAPHRKPSRRSRQDGPKTQKLPNLPPVPETKSQLHSLSTGPNPNALSKIEDDNVPNDAMIRPIFG